ncbi:ABC transporter permease [uncultured Schumannella sp.]|uniref:ABC transporter permease n=1 Tax=uncultured Schumannella sp. TaxID=1195956 RepID=UPI0025E1229F|nr:multidrug ABC transporter permease [uncultured Schumannella sp.]
MSSPVAGVRPLLAASLKQDARNFAPWIALVSVLPASSIALYIWIFPEQSARAELAMAVGLNPALALIFGTAGDLLTDEGFTAWRSLALGCFFASLMAIFIVVRTSRASEDSGQAELFASGVMGREARLAASVGLAFLASIGLGVVSFLATIAFGADPAAIAVLSLTYTASGFMFAGVAAIAAQLASEARAATAIAVTVLGVLFVARGYFEASGAEEWTSWVTPIGWMQQTDPASEQNYAPFLIALAFTIVTLGIAFALHAHRDFGAGVIPPRPGPARGGLTSSVWGLAIRLNAGSIVSWLIAFVALGFVFGYLSISIADLIETDATVAQLLAVGAASEDELVFRFMTTLLALAGIIAAVSGVGVIMRGYADEVAGRVDPILATAVSRTRYQASNTVVALLTSGLALLIGVVVIGVVAASLTDQLEAGEIIRQGLATIPAMWVLVALAHAVVGAEPSRRIAGWMGTVATFGLTILGPIFNLWDWILGISPFYHVPIVTAADADFTGWWIVNGVGLLLLTIGFAGFRRRDLA